MLFISLFGCPLTYKEYLPIRAPRGTGWDEQNGPIGLIGSDRPVPWDDFQKFSVPYGMGRPMGYPIIPWDVPFDKLFLQSTHHTLIYEFHQVYCTLSSFDIYFTVKLPTF
jgi:hypothetical protein